MCYWWKVTVTIPSYWQQYDHVQCLMAFLSSNTSCSWHMMLTVEPDPGCEVMIYSVHRHNGRFWIPIRSWSWNTWVHYWIKLQWHVRYSLEWQYHPTTRHEQVVLCRFGRAEHGCVESTPRYWTQAACRYTAREYPVGHFHQSKRGHCNESRLQKRWRQWRMKLWMFSTRMTLFRSSDVESWPRRFSGRVGKVQGSMRNDPRRWMYGGLGSTFFNRYYSVVRPCSCSCHIDTVWLWPYSVTTKSHNKSTQIDVMMRYWHPEHRFAARQLKSYILLFRKPQRTSSWKEILSYWWRMGRTRC